MKALIAIALAGATLGGGAYWYVSSGPEARAPGIRVDVTDLENGKVTVSWTSVKSIDGAAVTGYEVRPEPDGTDRVPPPSLVTPPAQRVPATVSSLTVSGLLEDCHQLYQVVVTPETGPGSGPAGKSPVFRPSGIVESGKAPPYVVILLDGINESQPGFTMNPYKPTLDGNPSYCPEARNASSGTEAEADFAGAPNGPWSFFHKWNFGEVKDGQAVGPNDKGYDESAPRAVAYPKPPPNVVPGTYTHSFMLDAIASRGAIILPFSYKGYGFAPNFQAHPGFSYYGYGGCQATPGCPGAPLIPEDAKLLDGEVNDAASVWPTSKIVVMGHSQGGLIAFEWWACSHNGLPQSAAKDCGGVRTTLPPNFVAGFSLDSPITGACGQAFGHGCFGPRSYPEYDQRAARDPAYVHLDAPGGRPFYLIGTYGDSPIGGYQSGTKTLEHQLLFTAPESAIDSACGDPRDESACPAAPPDHISDCPVDGVPNLPEWEKSAAHYVEKFCPSNVNYFNTVLGLSLDQAGPRPPCSSDTFLDVARSGVSSQYTTSIQGVGQPTCVEGYAEQDFIPYPDGQQAPFFFKQEASGQWTLVEGGASDPRGVCSAIPPAIMAKLGFGCPTSQTQSCSIPRGAEGGTDLPFTTTGLSCADGTRLVKAVIAAIPDYGTAGTSVDVQGFICPITPPAGYPPGSQGVSAGWQVTCTKGTETLSFELPG